MAISGIGNPIPPNIQQILNIRRQLDDLQRQLGTGQKADLYSGLGPQSGLAVGLNRAIFNGDVVRDELRLALGSEIVTQRAYMRQGRGSVAVTPGQWSALFGDARFGPGRLDGAWFHAHSVCVRSG